MSKQEDLVKLDRGIKDLEIRAKTFTVNMDAIKKELDFLGTVEEQLDSNIKYLKKVKTVALASEYKKAKEDLKKTKIRLSQLKGDLTANERAYKELESLLKKNQEAYDKLSQQNDNNVLQGKFGKRNA
jgi:chromosome segregation ATPase